MRYARSRTLPPASPTSRARLVLTGCAVSAALLLGGVGCGGGGSPDEAKSFEAGVALQEDGKWDQAIAAYDAVLADDPEHAGALFNRGVAKLEAGDAKGAVADFDALLALAPSDTDALLWRGSAYLAQGETDKAIKDFDAVLEESILSAEAFALRAEAHLEAGNLDSALVDADAAARLVPDDPSAYERRAAILDAMDEPEAADVERSLAAVTARIADDPEDEAARVRRGMVFFVMDEPELALIDLDAVADAHPNNALVRLLRGQCYASLNLPAQALVDLTAVIELPDAEPELVAQARMSRAAVFESRGAYADAIADYEQLHTQPTPGGIEATVRLARLRAGCPEATLRRPSQAVTLATDALARFDAAAADSQSRPAAEADTAEPGPDPIDPEDRWFYLDTLAAAQFADGQVDVAIATQTQAATAASDDVRDAVNERLQAYRDAAE